MSSGRVQMDIISYGTKIITPINQQRFIPPLKKMTPDLMSRIKPLGIGALKPSHSVDQIRLRRLKEEMIMLCEVTDYVAFSIDATLAHASPGAIVAPHAVW